MRGEERRKEGEEGGEKAGEGIGRWKVKGREGEEEEKGATGDVLLWLFFGVPMRPAFLFL